MWEKINPNDKYCGECGWHSESKIVLDQENQPQRKSGLVSKAGSFISSFSPAYLTLITFFIVIVILFLLGGSCTNSCEISLPY